MKRVRLHVFMAQAGVASRRRCEVLIEQGKVRVNGQAVRQVGTQIDPSRDVVEVNGEVLEAEAPLTVVFHKPRGVVTTLSDPQGRKTVRDFLDPSYPRIYPVGRLDWDSEGLLLLTNEGELARRLMHPSFGVPRTYQVKVKGQVSGEQLACLRRGVELERAARKKGRETSTRARDGETSPQASVRVMKRLARNCWLEVVIQEGRRRVIRRMLEAVGLSVIRLVRVGIGPLSLGSLSPGKMQVLGAREVKKLRRAVGMS